MLFDIPYFSGRLKKFRLIINTARVPFSVLPIQLTLSCSMRRLSRISFAIARENSLERFVGSFETNAVG